MKTLKLKKDVVEQLTSNAANKVMGGTGNSVDICQITRGNVALSECICLATDPCLATELCVFTQARTCAAQSIVGCNSVVNLCITQSEYPSCPCVEM